MRFSPDRVVTSWLGGNGPGSLGGLSQEILSICISRSVHWPPPWEPACSVSRAASQAEPVRPFQALSTAPLKHGARWGKGWSLGTWQEGWNLWELEAGSSCCTSYMKRAIVSILQMRKLSSVGPVIQWISDRVEIRNHAFSVWASTFFCLFPWVLDQVVMHATRWKRPVWGGSWSPLRKEGTGESVIGTAWWNILEARHLSLDLVQCTLGEPL